MTDLIVQSRRVVTPRGCVAATVYLRDGAIERVADFDDVQGGVEVVDCGARVVMAGVIDAQVQVGASGLGEGDGFAHATRAAAAGGVTTLVDATATSSAEALGARQRAAHGNLHVDVGFWGSVAPDNLAQLAALGRVGVLGFQCVLSPEGGGESARVSPADLEAIVARVGEWGAPLVCHAELGDALDAARAVWAHGDPTHYALYLASRPPGAEVQGVALLAELSAQHRTRLHVAQLSTAMALAFVRRARARGVEISVGTSPHYLYLSSDAIRNGATQFKCAPPIRSRANRDKLWRGLATGEIDLVSSNHIPALGAAVGAAVGADGGRFDEAAGGIASLQLLLPVMWTGAKARGHTLEELSCWLSQAPARLCGLAQERGQIAPGFRADLVVWDPEAEFVVDAHALEAGHQPTPYHGCRLSGVVHMTFLGGKPVYCRDSDAHRFFAPVGEVAGRGGGPG